MKKLVFLLCIVLLPSVLLAQVEDDFVPQTDFDSFQQQINQRFDQYKDSINIRFAKELERQWDEFQVFKGEKRPTRPKPALPPKSESGTKVPTSDELPAGTVKPAPQPQPPAPQPQLPPQPQQPKMSQLSSDFFHQPLQWNFPVGYRNLLLEVNDEKAVASFWLLLSQEGNESFWTQIRQNIAAMSLNDWGVYALAGSVARQIFPDNPDAQALTAIFIVNNLGYKAKVGRSDGQLVCLLPFRDPIFDVSFIIEGNERYYVFYLSPHQERDAAVFTYNVAYPTAGKVFDMNIYKPLAFRSSIRDHIFSAKWRGKDVRVSVDCGLLEFYNAYPQVGLDVYANAAVSEAFASQVKTLLSPQIQDLDEYGAVSVLLGFMHKIFPYIHDNEQFGHEKYFFCEENFFYHGSDCEDRSILFAYLVKEFVGLDVALADYPDHVATAVRFTDPSVSGDFFMLRGEKYIVCDPTYLGAAVGESMPQYKKTKADLIEIRK